MFYYIIYEKYYKKYDKKKLPDKILTKCILVLCSVRIIKFATPLLSSRFLGTPQSSSNDIWPGTCLRTKPGGPYQNDWDNWDDWDNWNNWDNWDLSKETVNEAWRTTFYSDNKYYWF